MFKPRHIAIIMDGNGRWAKARGLSRTAGHKAGMEALYEIVKKAGELKIGWLTLFAFSSENWSRPHSEVSDLMGLLKLFIRRDLAELHSQNVRVRIIGERESLTKAIRRLLDEAETLTAANTGLCLVVAFNYGARDEIARAMCKIGAQIASGRLDPACVTPDMITAHLDTAGIPDPDLVIRTSGEMRLSNFLLWQVAYSEFLFVECFWPDFKPYHLVHAIETFQMRERRFGGIEQLSIHTQNMDMIL